MHPVKFMLLCSSCALMVSCNNDDRSGSKNPVPETSDTAIISGATDTSKTNTAGFLKSRHMIQALYSEIPANSSMTVPGTSVYYPVLHMKAGSRLIIPPSYMNCTIVIGKGSFDANTQIIADGANGTDGIKPVDEWDRHGWWQAAAETNGAKGVNGTDGTYGGSAVHNLKIQMGLVKLLTLDIHANGGRGGNGGNGGTGQIGGNKKGMFGSNGDGGEGGDAGSGKNGGNGGNVSVEIWNEGGNIDLPTAMQHLSVIAIGGSAGRAGVAGNGREAGNNSGPHGGPGKSGSDGYPGRNGITKITVIPKPPLP